MSVIIERFLQCDRCFDRTYGVDNKAGAITKYQRAGALSEGWSNVGNRDYCDYCTAIRKAKRDKI